MRCSPSLGRDHSLGRGRTPNSLAARPLELPVCRDLCVTLHRFMPASVGLSIRQADLLRTRYGVLNSSGVVTVSQVSETHTKALWYPQWPFSAMPESTSASVHKRCPASSHRCSASS